MRTQTTGPPFLHLQDYSVINSQIIKMVVTDYLNVYTDFVQDRLDSLVIKQCKDYNVYGNRQLTFRDEVLSDVGITFCYICKNCFDRPRKVSFSVYLVSALRHQVKYSIAKQLGYYRNCKKYPAYYIHKFGAVLDGQIIDLRIKSPSEKLFRLSFEDFDFSPLNKTEMQIIQLFFGGEFEIREIAQLLKISEGTVRKYKNRALKKLRNTNKHLLN